jgi:hypothetical protein
MGAGGADREIFIAAPREQNRLLADVSRQHAAVRHLIGRDPHGQVGTGGFRLR